MMNFIPILSLKYCLYPGEILNLRLTNKADIQLIKDSKTTDRDIGVFFKNRNADFQISIGTLAQITEITKQFKNGTVYCRVKGLSTFEILYKQKKIPEKSYSGVIVKHLTETAKEVNKEMRKQIYLEVKRLYRLMHLNKKFTLPLASLVSFDLAHKIGFNKKQEYELLTLDSEIQRMEYIRRHLKRMMPVVLELEAMKRRIQANGHYKNLT